MVQPTKPSKPSAGALRAANQFVRHSNHIYRWRSEPEDVVRELAEVIDHFTGMAELLNATKNLLMASRAVGVLGATEISIAEEWLEQAIAKCESGTGSD